MKLNMCFLIVYFVHFFSVGIQGLFAQENNGLKRWDLEIINEAHILSKLLKNYYEGDTEKYWLETKESLEYIINNYQDSRWVDDAFLMLACGQAGIEKDIEQAIMTLEKVIQDYPNESTVVSGWYHWQGRCEFNNVWLSEVVQIICFNDDYSILGTRPYDRDDYISICEKIVLLHFEHLDQYPNLTKDVARYLIAQMLYHSGKILEASLEYEKILPNISVFKQMSDFDLIASKGSYGFLIRGYQIPIFRIQYSACMELINIYLSQGDGNKLFNVITKLNSICKPEEGWYWNINQYLGDIYTKCEKWDSAVSNYENALESLQHTIVLKAEHIKKCYEDDCLFYIRDDSESWEDVASKDFANDIHKINESLSEARSHLPTSIKQKNNENKSQPTSFHLSLNYPNPFNSETQIEYSLINSEQKNVELIIINTLGEIVRTLVNEKKTAGVYRENWNGNDMNGKQLPNGTYVLKLTVNSEVQTQKILLLK